MVETEIARYREGSGSRLMADHPSAESSSPPEPDSLLRSKDYRMLLVFAAVIGVLVSLASWGYLELIHYLQQWLYKDLPSGLSLSPVPTWWPLPVLAVASVPIAFALARMPGGGGHKPAEGLKAGPPTQPNELPGVLLASLASIGFGMVLGPEAPLIAIAGGLGIFAVRSARKDAPDQVLALIAGAASFAAMSSLFGSPIVGAVIIIEAAGLGGATLPVILLPGLLAAGIGSLVFIGMGSLTGLSSSAYAIAPLSLPKYHAPTSRLSGGRLCSPPSWQWASSPLRGSGWWSTRRRHVDPSSLSLLPPSLSECWRLLSDTSAASRRTWSSSRARTRWVRWSTRPPAFPRAPLRCF